MSKVKGKVFAIFILLIMMSFFVFGCDNVTKVEDIYFDLQDGQTEISFVVGQSFDLKDLIVVSPSYASNKGYHIYSLNTSIVSVNGSSVTALKEGETVIRVVANDNNLKEDLVAVSVKREATTLSAPKNLSYNSVGETISFDSVPNASSYTLLINNEEFSLGNSNTFALSNYSTNPYDKILSVKVRANSASYSYAYLDSEYSREYKIYQHSKVNNVQVVDGVLHFENNDLNGVFDVSLNDELISENQTRKVNVLTNLDEKFAGLHAQLKVVAKASEQTRQSFGSNLHYFDSVPVSLWVDVLEVPNVTINSGVVVWQNVANASSYKVNVDGINYEIDGNVLDLKTLPNYNNFLNRASDYLVTVYSQFAEGSKNILSTSSGGSAKFNRMTSSTISVENNQINWSENTLASTYTIDISANSVLINEANFPAKTTDKSFSLKNFDDDTVYTFSVVVDGGIVDDVYYLPSFETTKQVLKQKNIEASINDYVLSFETIPGDKYNVKFKVDETQTENIDFTSSTNSYALNLKGYNFESGNHLIEFKHIGNYTPTVASGKDMSVDSDVTNISFVQLAPKDIEIENSVLSVNSVKEENSSVRLRIEKVGDLVVCYDEYVSSVELNSTDVDAQNYLPSGNYVAKVFIEGNGSTTFSYLNNGSLVASDSCEFEVLASPTNLILIDKAETNIGFDEVTNAESYAVYEIEGSTQSLLGTTDTNVFDTNILEGSKTIKVQAVGDGITKLNSVLSDAVTISKLSTPTLKLNNTTNTITLTSGIDSVHVNNYLFTINGENVDYNFSSPYPNFVIGSNVITITAIAQNGTSGNYYINSNTYTLGINKIDATSTINVNEDEKLVIIPQNQEEEYGLVLSFKFYDNSEVTLTSSDGVLTNGTYNLPYLYYNGAYYVELLNVEHCPLIEKFSNTFNVKAKFIAEHNEYGDVLINSEYSDSKSIETTQQVTIYRSAQNIVFNNVIDANIDSAFDSYTFIVNNDILDCEINYTTSGNNYVVPMKQIFDYLEENYIDTSLIKLSVMTESDSSSKLSMNSSPIYLAKQNDINLTYSKGLNSSDLNATFISANTTNTSYEKDYYFEFTDELNNVVTRRFETNANGVINIEIDELELNGDFQVKALIRTSGSFVEDSRTVYVFNSNEELLQINRIDSVQNIYVSNNVLYYSSVDNAFNYEIYSTDGNNYTYIDSTSNTYYSMEGMSSSSNIVVKAIAINGLFANADYSDSISIIKPTQPNIVNNDGIFNVVLNSNVIDLLDDENVDIHLVITNSAVEDDIVIDLKSIEDERITLDSSTLIIDPCVILRYNSNSILREDLTFTLTSNYSGTNEEDVYYLNSNPVNYVAYGLFAPTNVDKTSTNNATIENLTWEANVKNTISGVDINVGYIFKVEYNDGESEQIYYSNDNLAYFSNENITTYPNLISSTSVHFPYGVLNESLQAFEMAFGTGVYKVSVRAISAAQVGGYNIFASNYSVSSIFKILTTPVLSNNEGVLRWNEQTDATSYKISIFEGYNLVASHTEVVNEPYYELNSSYSGLVGITIQALSSTKNALNSEVSDIVYFYRLKEATSISVDDGELKLIASPFVSKVGLTFVDVDNSAYYYEAVVERNAEAITSLNNFANSFDSLNSSKLNTINDTTSISLENAIGLTALISGHTYTVNVKLYGNSLTVCGVLNSSETTALSGINVTKLNTVIDEVESGIIHFDVDSEYSSGLNVNYKFGELTPTDFWDGAVIYKMILNTSSSPVVVYALDYNRFIGEVGEVQFDNATSGTEYTTTNGLTYVKVDNRNNLCAYAKYRYGDGSYFTYNIYKDNSINFNYNNLYYYSLVADPNVELNNADLSVGGSYLINLYMLGGDSYNRIDNNVLFGYLTSNSYHTVNFDRYNENNIRIENGKISFINLTKQNSDGDIIDYPVYKISIAKLNGDSKIVYVYNTPNEDETDYLNAITVAEKNDALNYSSALFVPAEYDEENSALIWFDMSKYFDAGAYSITLQTLAGVGVQGLEETYIYPLNAITPPISPYAYHKLKDVTLLASNGSLEFYQSYITQNDANIYFNIYEITLCEQGSSNEIVYTIDENSEGVKLNTVSHKIVYTLPSVITVGDDEYSIDEGTYYTVKIRALSNESNVINGSYKQESEEDITITVLKTEGINDVSINDGVLKWVVPNYNSSTYNGVIVRMVYDTYRVIEFTINGNIYSENGVYQYHYYEFTDGNNYPLISSNSQTSINSGISYYVAMSVVGKNTSENVLNSNYCNYFVATRLSTVSASSIVSNDGVLTWDSVLGAIGYEVVVTNQINNTAYNFNISTNSIDLSNEIGEGTYSVKIKAIGNYMIHAKISETVVDFEKLGKVSNIGIDGNYFVWDSVENAQGYEVVITYISHATDEQTSSTATVLAPECRYEVSDDIEGAYTIKVKAIGVGVNKILNSDYEISVGSNSRPAPINSLDFDKDNGRFIWKVDETDFLSTDTILVKYNMYEYGEFGTSDSPYTVNTAIARNSYVDSTTGETYYYYPITKLGIYSNFTVQISRNGALLSYAVNLQQDSDFNFYAYGEGSEDNPYRINNASQLFNITYFANRSNVYFELTTDISLAGVTYIHRLEEYSAIISNEFKGILDGKGYSIYGFNLDKSHNVDTISITNTLHFALFNNLNGATVKNLNIGKSVVDGVQIQTVLNATFENNDGFNNVNTNEISLSMLATSANNATLLDVNVPNLKIVLQTTTFNTGNQLKGKVCVAGLIGTDSNSTLTNCDVKIDVVLDIPFADSSTVFVSGVIAYTNNTQTLVDNANVVMSVSSNKNVMVGYIGGIVARYSGLSAVNKGVNNSNVTLNANMASTTLKATYVGGIVGWARYIKIDNCYTKGRIVYTNASNSFYLGGVAGMIQGVIMTDTGTEIDIDVNVTSVNGKRLGTIAGSINNYSSVTSSISAYVVGYTYVGQTIVGVDSITVGAYSEVQNGVTLNVSIQE